MTSFELIGLLLSVAAVLGYLNLRFIRLPTTIGIMLLSLAASLTLIGLGLFAPGISEWASQLVAQIDFRTVLLDVMLSYLLYAGALHVKFSDLHDQKWAIGVMATAGVLISTFFVGGGAYFLFGLFGYEVPFIHCLLFGALISPTDPVAVLGLLKKARVARSLETKITGESLFNDGIGVVIFLALLSISNGSGDVSPASIGKLFGVEVLGGLALGGWLGWMSYSLLRRIDNYQVEILITLAVVTGGYSLALALHLSGPLAMVVAGLMTGNQGRALAMSKSTRKHLDLFWELVDEILNALLFALIGLELLVVADQFSWKTFALGAAAIVMVLACRAAAISVPIFGLSFFRKFEKGTIAMLTWGGLRGGISVALVLSLPPGDGRELLLKITYMIVIFSIAVQGLTVGKLYRRINR